MSTFQLYIASYQLVPHIVRELAISYLRHYKLDFDAVKSKVGLHDEYISTSYKASLQLVPHKVRELAISYLSHYKLDFDSVKSKVGLLDENIPSSYKASYQLVSQKVWNLSTSVTGSPKPALKLLPLIEMPHIFVTSLLIPHLICELAELIILS